MYIKDYLKNKVRGGLRPPRTLFFEIIPNNFSLQATEHL